MKITGSRTYVKFDLENGCVVKAGGEMLLNRKFAVYKETMRFTEAPDGEDVLSPEQTDELIRLAQERMVRLIFV